MSLLLHTLILSNHRIMEDASYQYSNLYNDGKYENKESIDAIFDKMRTQIKELTVFVAQRVLFIVQKINDELNEKTIEDRVTIQLLNEKNNQLEKKVIELQQKNEQQASWTQQLGGQSIEEILSSLKQLKQENQVYLNIDSLYFQEYKGILLYEEKNPLVKLEENETKLVDAQMNCDTKVDLIKAEMYVQNDVQVMIQYILTE